MWRYVDFGVPTLHIITSLVIPFGEVAKGLKLNGLINVEDLDYLPGLLQTFDNQH